MTVENANFINNLNETYPRAQDLIKEGDDHIRLVKSTLKNTFPGFNSSVKMTSSKLNMIDEMFEVKDGKVSIAGGLNVGSGKELNMGGNRITNVGDPIDPEDAVTLKFLKGGGTGWPVGSVYMTVDTRNPSAIFGFGTWEKFAEGRVIIGAGTVTDSSNSNATYLNKGYGGNLGVTLTERNLPRHTHSMAGITTAPAGGHKHDSGVAIRAALDDPYGVASMTPNRHSYEHHRYGDNVGRPWTSTVPDHTHSFSGEIGYTGNGDKISLIQPWASCYIWTRTA